jgi:hypothetical protein
VEFGIAGIEVAMSLPMSFERAVPGCTLIEKSLAIFFINQPDSRLLDSVDDPKFMLDTKLFIPLRHGA